MVVPKKTQNSNSNKKYQSIDIVIIVFPRAPEKSRS